MKSYFTKKPHKPIQIIRQKSKRGSRTFRNSRSFSSSQSFSSSSSLRRKPRLSITGKKTTFKKSHFAQLQKEFKRAPSRRTLLKSLLTDNLTILSYLPNEILIRVFSYLSIYDIANVVSASKDFAGRIEMNAADLWKQKVQQHFPHLYEESVQRLQYLYEANLDQELPSWQQTFKDTFFSQYHRSEPYILQRFGVSQTKNELKLRLTAKKLLSAIKENDLERFKALFKYKMQHSENNYYHFDTLDKYDIDGITLLEWAIQLDRQNFLDYIFSKVIKRYGHANARASRNNKIKADEYSRTLLHWYILTNQPLNSIKDYLVINRVNLIANFHFPFKKSPTVQAIHLACYLGNLEVVKLLIKKNPTLINQADGLQQTPLIWAIIGRRQAVVNYLINRGAIINTSVIRHQTNNHHFKFLSYAPIHYAIHYNRKLILNKLLEHGADLNLRVNDENSSAPIHLAVLLNRKTIIQSLLAHDPTLLNLTDGAGRTALAIATDLGHYAIVKKLLTCYYAKIVLPENAHENNIKMETETEIEDEPVPPENRHENNLAENNAENETEIEDEPATAPNDTIVSEEDRKLAKQCITDAFHIACRENKYQIAQLFLEQYPTLAKLSDNNRETAITLAAANGHVRLVELLVNEHYNQTDDLPLLVHALESACRHGQIAVVEFLIQLNKTFLHYQDIQGVTPVMWAAASNQYHIVRFFAEQGADLDKRTVIPSDYAPRTNTTNQTSHRYGYTAMHYAAENGHANVVKELLKFGASPFTLSANGEKPDKVTNDDDIKKMIKLERCIFGKPPKPPVAYRALKLFSPIFGEKISLSQGSQRQAAQRLKTVIFGNAKQVLPNSENQSLSTKEKKQIKKDPFLKGVAKHFNVSLKSHR